MFGFLHSECGPNAAKATDFLFKWGSSTFLHRESCCKEWALPLPSRRSPEDASTGPGVLVQEGPGGCPAS